MCREEVSAVLVIGFSDIRRISLKSLERVCDGGGWHIINVPRLTPLDSRSDLAFKFRGGGLGLAIGGATGRSSTFLVDSLTGVGSTAKSTLVRRLAALTGGEDGSAGTCGVLAAFTLGTGTFLRGIFGVCSAGRSLTAGSTRGADVTAGLTVTLDSGGGVLGSDGGEDGGSVTSLSSKWMTEAPCGIGRAGRVGFARGSFVDTEMLFLGAGLSSKMGLDTRRVAELVEV